MNRKRYMPAAVAGLLLAFIISGCASYGKLRLESGPEKKMTTETLNKNWRDYTIYYAGLNEKHPSAVMFDRKDDDRAVVGDRWFKVENKEDLVDLIDYIQRETPIGKYYPRLWKVLGPDDHLYGYMVSAWNHAVMKVVDDKTMYVHDLPLPPNLAADGDRIRREPSSH
ncbi:MAG: hypothetical protein PVG99_09300 [Desulfobacteraceae bacterium]